MIYDFKSLIETYNFFNLTPRFNPSRIDSIEMTLGAVMNGKGNGNKDEVGFPKTFSLNETFL